MGRQRKKGNDLRAILIVIGLGFGVVWITSVLEAIGNRIHGARNPLIPAIGLGMMVLGVVLLAGLITYLYWRRKKTKQRQFIELLALTPKQFEHAMAHLLHDLGYRHVQHVGKSRDLGIDLKATTPDGQRAVIQCKRLAPGSKIGSPDIQSFIGMALMHHRAERGIFVTTAEFSGPAIELAGQHPIDLWDGKFLSTALARIHGPGSGASQAARLSAQPHVA